METVAYVACALLVVVLGVLTDIAVSARAIKSTLARQQAQLEAAIDIFIKCSYPTGWSKKDEAGICVWVFRGGVWKLEGKYCGEGYEPGPPPSRKDAVEGYAVKQVCVKKPG
jgi:hypothetical protein